MLFNLPACFYLIIIQFGITALLQSPNPLERFQILCVHFIHLVLLESFGQISLFFDPRPPQSFSFG